ncbi:MAG: 30S ribosomal protein S9 [Microgenomates group bacterium GW2011_GWC1_37_8]|uniref:30S ribosomal protein S9 n=2 Tax=Candidatus Woeseibacteriota TaxID=1752722 RepID=A0A0G0L1Y8_9BACT|nr:MAG: 30S ribosomal protein S9 [Microgenomates group bacterium GW2011_GWC1_37_8]KKQ85993.1 MAG: 30S ribosomal protein S9 [Candidatus Woesebacteria bacterium GW2011_GWB1_38_8]OGM21264.1 MAG: 30S ribosomal protein S9 [Candidatus Woesebacteria bacterium RIFCSPHIGHO2_01_FULL_38_9b]
MINKNKKDYIYAIGRRKGASARVRLYRGKGESTVNGKPIAQYFSGEVFKETWSKPFRLIDGTNSYYVTTKVSGGGIKGQLEATTHAIARSLSKLDKENFRPVLKKAGLLTRDARIRERRKIGMGGKARRKKQSPKR